MSLNVILFGNRIIADVIKLREGHTVLGWTFILCDWWSYKKRRRHRPKTLRENALWWWKQNLERCFNKPRGTKNFWQHWELRKGPQREHGVLLALSSLQNWEKHTSVVLSHPVICSSSPRKLINLNFYKRHCFSLDKGGLY